MRRDRLPTPVFLGFPGGSAGKESNCNAGDLGLIPGLGISPGGGHATHSSILAGRTPWTEEPGGLQSMGLQESDMTERLSPAQHLPLYRKTNKQKLGGHTRTVHSGGVWGDSFFLFFSSQSLIFSFAIISVKEYIVEFWQL